MTLILTHSDIVQLLDRDEVRKAVEVAHGGLAAGEYCESGAESRRLARQRICVADGGRRSELVAVKLLCDIPSNRDRGLPTQRSTILVASATTGESLAVLDGRAITAIRTAAASAVATDHLARASASTLGLVGAGNLAVEHAFAIAGVRTIERIAVWSRSGATLDTFRAATESLGIPVEAAGGVEDVLSSADVVCTLTPSRHPIVCGDWLQPGQHINAVGAPPRPDHREIDSRAMSRARIVVDSHSTAMSKSGGILLAIADGAITEDDARTELGHVVTGAAPGRVTDEDITMFESVGIALQDLATANLVIASALQRGLGTAIDLRA